jgi:hypothetical protein
MMNYEVTPFPCLVAILKNRKGRFCDECYTVPCLAAILKMRQGYLGFVMHATSVPCPAAILKSGKDRFYESFYSRPLPFCHFGPVPCLADILKIRDG